MLMPKEGRGSHAIQDLLEHSSTVSVYTCTYSSVRTRVGGMGSFSRRETARVRPRVEQVQVHCVYLQEHLGLTAAFYTLKNGECHRRQTLLDLRPRQLCCTGTGTTTVYQYHSSD